jgi:uncharacterized membrane protein YkoI
MKRLAYGGLCLLVFSALVYADHNEAYRLLRAGEILSLESILQQQKKTRPGQVLEVELDEKHGVMVYELEVLDERGTVWELLFDARSGELLEREVED